MTAPAYAPPTRRLALGVGAAALTTLAGAGARGASSAGGLDLTSDPGRLRAYMLMKGALDDRLTVGFVSGRYYGVVDAEVRPLYNVHGATFARYRKRADGYGYDGASYEVAFFTDLETDKVLEQWRNPYSGETVPAPKNTTFPPGVVIIGANLETRLPKPFPGMVSSDKVWPAQISGDDVWMTQDTRVAVTAPGAAKPVRYNELVTLHARASDLGRPGVAKVAAQTNWTATVSWRPWLKMGDRPGHLLGNGQGRSVDKVEELPAPWLAAAAQYRPEVLKDPGAALKSL